MSDAERAGILERGLASEFWRLFCAHIEQEWGSGGRRYEQELTDLANQTDPDPVVVRKMQQIAVCRREILRLQKWPEEELNKCKESATTEPRPGRAPVNREIVTGMTRGGL